MKSFFLSIALLLIFSREVTAQLVRLELDTFFVHTGLTSDGVDLSGQITYRLYAVCEDSADYLLSFNSGFGPYEHFRIYSTTPFYQHENGGFLASDIPCGIGLNNSLAFDSWITIDCEDSCSCNAELFATGYEPYEANFEQGGELFMFSNGSYDDNNNPVPPYFEIRRGVEAGGDKKVLLGQFTSSGDVHFHACIEIMPKGIEGILGLDYFPVTFNGYSAHFPASACSYGSCISGSSNPNACNFIVGAEEYEPPISPQCNDPEACNYSTSVTCAATCYYEGDLTNVTCESAIPIAYGDSAFLSLCGGTVSLGGNDCNYDVEREWWFSFTYLGGLTYFTPFNALPANRKMAIQIYSSCESNSMYCVASNLSSTFPVGDIGMTIGETYLIRLFNNTAYGFILSHEINGCTDPNACNFDPIALVDDGSCLPGTTGCMDPNRCNFDPNALCPGTCEGYKRCLDPEACNYSPNGICGGNTCYYTIGNEFCENSFEATLNTPFVLQTSCIEEDDNLATCGPNTNYYVGWYFFIYPGGDIIVSEVIPNSALRYIALFTNCQSEEILCSSTNESILAHWNCSDGLVPGEVYYLKLGTNNPTQAEVLIESIHTGCTDPSACNFNACSTFDDGSCGYEAGCSDFDACNYSPNTVCEDGSCEYPGCTDTNACNYNEDAGCDDGSCKLPAPNETCSQAMPLVFDELIMAEFVCSPYAVEPYENCASVYGNQKDLWFSFDYQVGGDIILHFNYSSAYYNIIVWDGCGGTQLFCAGDESSPYWSNDLEYIFNTGTGLMPGNTYLIQMVSGSPYLEEAIMYFSLEHSIIYGCTDSNACNFQLTANVDDNSCLFGVSGCTDNAAYNFNAEAICDDGSCISYCDVIDFDLSGVVDISDLEELLSHFGCVGNCDNFDVATNGTVGMDDLILFIGYFPPCSNE